MLQERKYCVIEFSSVMEKYYQKRKDINEFEQERDLSKNPVLLHVRVPATS